MYQMNGSYGQSAYHCSPLVVQGTNQLPGTAFVDPYWPGGSTATATFPQPPQSGDAIVVGCESTLYAPPPGNASDNQSNTYLLVEYGSEPAGGSTQLFAAPDVVSSQSLPFTVTCTETPVEGNNVNMFALEIADLGSGSLTNMTNLVDSVASYSWDPQPTEVPCTPPGTFLTTSRFNDLIMSVYNADCDNPANFVPTPGAIPACIGGSGNTCSSTNIDVAWPGAISIYTAPSPGQYLPEWSCNVLGDQTSDDCSVMALKPIGP